MSAPVKGCEKCAGTGVRSVHVEFPNGYGAGGSVNCDCSTAPVPVVNEVAEAVAQALVDTRDENVAMWKDVEVLKDVVAYLTEAVCESPTIKAAFEAQAKLEAERSRVVTEIVAALRDSIGWIEDDAYADWVEKRFLWEGGEGS